MGNTWKGHSEEKLKQSELDAFISSGVEPSTITQEDVNLDGTPGSENYIHTVICTSKVANA